VLRLRLMIFGRTPPLTAIANARGQAAHPVGDPPTAANEPSPGAPEPITKHSGRFLPSTRYRHPGDVIRLIGSGLVLTAMLAAVAVAPGRLTGAGAAAVTWLGSDPAGRLLTGVVQVAFVAAAAGAVDVALWHRRFRLLAGLAVGAVAAGAVAAGAALAGIWYLAGNSHPDAVTAAGEQHSWLASAAFPWPPLLAAAVAVTVAAAPWLSRPWRRTSSPPSGSATTSCGGCGLRWTGCTAPGWPTGH
jgi:hypothetical protein